MNFKCYRCGKVFSVDIVGRLKINPENPVCNKCWNKLEKRANEMKEKGVYEELKCYDI